MTSKIEPLRSWNLILVLCFWLDGTCAAAQENGEWPQWRGPNRDAVSVETNLLSSWTGDGPELVWQVSGLGEGYSSVVVAGGRVFTTGKRDGDVYAFALSIEDGEKLWETRISSTSRTPCSTPTADGERLYVLDPDGHLVCMTVASGEVVWRVSYLDDFDGQMQSGRGYGESPLVDGAKLICTPGGKENTLVAINKYDGTTIWRAAIPELGPTGRDGAGFSSVVVSEAGGIRQYVQLVGRGLIGIDAANGKFLWGYNALANETANIPTPIVHDDYVFAANGYSAGSVLLQLHPDGNNGINVEEVYSLNAGSFQNHHGGIVLVGDSIYGGHGNNNGLPTCIDLKTGKVLWKRRGPGRGSAALVYADGNIYFRYQNGIMALIEASPEGLHLKGTFSIPGAGGDSWSHPVVAGGKLYLREKDSLLVYNVRQAVDTRAPLATTKQPHPTVLALKKLGVRVAEVDLSSNTQPDTRYEPIRRNLGHENTSLISVSVDKRHLSRQGTIIAPVVAQLKQLNAPLEMDVAGTLFSTAGIAQLKDVPGIQILDLELCGNITDNSLSELGALSNLKVLILAGTGITDSGLAHLKLLTNLAGLDLEVCDQVTDAGLIHLQALKHLQWLSLKRSGFGPYFFSDEALGHLEGLTRLQVLNLYGNRITDSGLDKLKSLTSLKDLDLNLTTVSDEGLAKLASLSDLERIELTATTGLGGPKISNQGIRHLTALPKLKHLVLVGAGLTDECLEYIAGMSTLTSVNVVDTQLTDDGIRFLKRALPNCEFIR